MSKHQNRHDKQVRWNLEQLRDRINEQLDGDGYAECGGVLEAAQHVHTASIRADALRDLGSYYERAGEAIASATAAQREWAQSAMDAEHAAIELRVVAEALVRVADDVTALNESGE